MPGRILLGRLAGLLPQQLRLLVPLVNLVFGEVDQPQAVRVLPHQHDLVVVELPVPLRVRRDQVIRSSTKNMMVRAGRLSPFRQDVR